MRTRLLPIAATLIACQVLAQDQAHPTSPNMTFSAPLRAVRFVENQGQFADGVMFRGECQSGTVFLREDDMLFVFPAPSAEGPRWSTVPMRFVDRSASLRVEGEALLPQVSNFFLGNDPSRWRSRVPHFDSVLYRGLYPGVDLRMRLAGERFQYDVIVQPGADLGQVEFGFPLGSNLRLSPDGALLLDTEHGLFRQDSPVVYQEILGVRVSVPAAFEQRGADSFGFCTSGPWDRSRPLIVDPVVSYSTYVGGTQDERGMYNGRPNFALLPNGDCVLSGGTDSAVGFHAPASGPMAYQEDFPGSTSAFLVVFTPQFGLAEGGVRSFTYLGGASQYSSSGTPPPCTGSGAYDTKVGADGSIYVSGSTSCSDFPTHRALQTAPTGPFESGFLTKLTDDLTTIVFSTYFGGPCDSSCMPLSLHDGKIYVAGHTSCDFQDGFPFRTSDPGNPLTPGGYTYDYQSAGRKGYLSVLTENLEAPVALTVHYTTLIGGDDGAFDHAEPCTPPLPGVNVLPLFPMSHVYGMAVEDGLVYLAGATNCCDFPIKPADAWRSTLAPATNFAEGFIVKINPDPFEPVTSEHLVASTFVGGSSVNAASQKLEYAFGIYVEDGRVYASGLTAAHNMVTSPNALAPTASDTSPTGQHAFALLLESDFRSVVFSTYLTGNVRTDSPIATMHEWSYGIHSLGHSRVVVTGQTNHTDFTTVCNPADGLCHPTYRGGALDGFVCVINYGGADLEIEYSTFLGGSGADLVFTSHYDPVQGRLYVAGLTSSLDFNAGVTGAYQDALVGGDDAFLVVLALGNAAFIRGDANGDGTVNIADAITVLNALFGQPPVQLPCMDAADSNDDGVVDIADAVTALAHLFGSATLPAPHGTCGLDPTDDALDCITPSCP